ncbi:caspase family protein [Methylobacterium sp. J-078]|uniref:caspase family protein n=1 Tax=Methylobacterium sp. J-078 TaxID=2836657 RepID=UPI001FBABCAB|nr:caspase family protein [Methylobacterium sp. J-078]MCJ2043890.1 caspase family protein [Methylobacterium sp. J-078]
MRARHSIATILLILTVFLVSGRDGAEAGSFSNARNALLIGNATYPDSDAALATPLGDVKALGDALRAKGFTVVTGENLPRERMQAAIDGFVRKVEPGSVALVFFSGYGIQVARKNYMVPVDARIWSEADVLRDGIGVDALMAELDRKGAGTRVVVLDASRRNPFERRFRSFSTGLAEMKTGPGLLGLYSAAPGSVVNEVSTAQSPFVTELVRQIGVSENSAVQAFTATREALSRDSRGQQVPALSAEAGESFAFDPARAKSEAKAEVRPEPKPEPTQKSARVEDKPAPPRPDAGKLPSQSTADAAAAKEIDDLVAAEEATARAFNRANAAGTRKAYEEFLSQHPAGTLASVARAEIARLDEARDKAPKSTTPAVPPAAPPTTKDTAWHTPPKPYSPAELQRKTSLDARIARSAKDPAAYYERGQFHAQRDDYSAALADFDQAIRLDPKNPEALNNRCWVRAITNDLSRALADCNQALTLRPNFVDALDSRGFVNLKSGALQAAISDYDAALAQSPTHSSALYGRGIARSRLGQRSQATEDLTGALALNPMIDKDFAQYGLR